MEIEVFTIEELREVLSISEAAIRALVKQNQIPHFFIGKKTIRFRKESIIQWLEEIEKKIKGAA
jgi:excisionase family DNA binding protein